MKAILYIGWEIAFREECTPLVLSNEGLFQICAVLLAVFFAALVGVGFGYYPARRAALLDPIEVLRSE